MSLVDISSRQLPITGPAAAAIRESRMIHRFRAHDRSIVLDFCKHCDRRGLTVLSVKGTVSRLAQVAETYPNIPFLLLGTEDIERVVDAIRGHDGGSMKANSRKAFVSNLRSFWKWAVTFDYTDVNPIDKVVNPKVRLGLPRPVTEADYQRAVSEAPTIALQLVFLLAGGAGLRIAEIAGLTSDEIDLTSRELRVTGKGDRERVVPLSDELAQLLAAHLATITTSILFADAFHAQQVSPGQLGRVVTAHFESLGLKYTAHQLRHRFASEAYEATEDLRVVQDLLGHSTPTTTAIYTQVRSPRKRTAIDAMSPATQEHPTS